MAVLFFILESVLDRAAVWANANSLGLEIVLGFMMPILLIGFIVFGIVSVLRSLFLIKKVGLCALLPGVFPMLTLALYLLIATEQSLWYRVVLFYFTYF